MAETKNSQPKEETSGHVLTIGQRIPLVYKELSNPNKTRTHRKAAKVAVEGRLGASGLLARI